MKLAFCLFRYFPYGGLQRDFLRIAAACRDRGHAVHVFTMAWEGDIPSSFQVHVVSASGFTNHRRSLNFARAVGERLAAEPFDAVIGFNKMPELDVYFAADPCYGAQARESKSWLYRLSPRFRIYHVLEQAVFAPAAGTQIILLTEAEKARYIGEYQTPAERFHLLPPGLDARDYQVPDPVAVRQQVRQDLGLGDGELLLLMVGSGFRTKGVDRSLRALAALPEEWRTRARLVVIGKGDAAPFETLAVRLGVAGRVSFLGTRDDVPRFMSAADLLLHPSHTEAAGMVLLEAMLMGLPVLCTAVCGYAFHVRAAGAGLLISDPFAQGTMDQLLLRMLSSPAERQVWSCKGKEYVAAQDISSLPEKAVRIIESVTRR
jgi:UDP-glucose:(heptosyl)LPS alpha-1,3-glucosyltransferase